MLKRLKFPSFTIHQSQLFHHNNKSLLSSTPNISSTFILNPRIGQKRLKIGKRQFCGANKQKEYKGSKTWVLLCGTIYIGRKGNNRLNGCLYHIIITYIKIKCTNKASIAISRDMYHYENHST